MISTWMTRSQRRDEAELGGEAKQKAEEAKAETEGDKQRATGKSKQDEKPGTEDDFEDGRTDEDNGDKPNDPALEGSARAEAYQADEGHDLRGRKGLAFNWREGGV